MKCPDCSTEMVPYPPLSGQECPSCGVIWNAMSAVFEGRKSGKSCRCPADPPGQSACFAWTCVESGCPEGDPSLGLDSRWDADAERVRQGAREHAKQQVHGVVLHVLYQEVVAAPGKQA